MRSLVVLLVLLSVAFAFRMDSEEAVGDVNWPFTNCNADSVKITALALTTQPAKSKNSTAKITGSVLSKVQLKEVAVGLTFNAGPVNVEYLPWAVKFDAGATLNYNYTFFVPDYFKAGKYTYMISFLNEADEMAGCLRFNWTI